jgi:PIN domain nuclease of toxin-antitoxin system
MRLLLDTHVFLWYIAADARLPDPFRVAIQDIANEAYLSAASIWEAVIKSQLGRLPLPGTPDLYLRGQRRQHLIESLPIDEGSVAQLAKLPLIHRDPFDRIILAQAVQHNLKILTVDAAIHSYGMQLFPAP